MSDHQTVIEKLATKLGLNPEAWQSLADNAKPLDWIGPKGFLGPELSRELANEATKANLFGQPIGQMDRDEMLATIGYLAREAKKGYMA